MDDHLSKKVEFSLDVIKKMRRLRADVIAVSFLCSFFFAALLPQVLHILWLAIILVVVFTLCMALHASLVTSIINGYCDIAEMILNHEKTRASEKDSV